jgi:hypothetical protein
VQLIDFVGDGGIWLDEGEIAMSLNDGASFPQELVCAG